MFQIILSYGIYSTEEATTIMKILHKKIENLKQLEISIKKDESKLLIFKSLRKIRKHYGYGWEKDNKFSKDYDILDFYTQTCKKVRETYAKIAVLYAYSMMDEDVCSAYLPTLKKPKSKMSK